MEGHTRARKGKDEQKKGGDVWDTPHWIQEGHIEEILFCQSQEKYHNLC